MILSLQNVTKEPLLLSCFTYLHALCGHLNERSLPTTLNVLVRKRFGASLVAQWLRMRLPMRGTRVRALVREDPTCRGATKPVRHNY